MTPKRLSAEELHTLHAAGEIHGKHWAKAVFAHIAALEAELAEARASVGIAAGVIGYEPDCLPRLENERNQARAEVARLRSVLEEIANLDYRGNREQGSVIALKALGEAK